MFLLDTNVLSASRRPERAPPGLQAWIGRTPPRHMHLSTITVMEIEIEALRLMRKDPTQASRLHRWLHLDVIPRFANRILDFTAAVALRSATLQVPDPRSTLDAMIAATALEHRLTVVTRNVRDFEPMGVAILNPWEIL